MKNAIKRLAYIFLYLPMAIFTPQPLDPEFASKKRIAKMNLGVAVLICVVGIGIIALFIYYVYLLATQ